MRRMLFGIAIALGSIAAIAGPPTIPTQNVNVVNTPLPVAVQNPTLAVVGVPDEPLKVEITKPTDPVTGNAAVTTTPYPFMPQSITFACWIGQAPEGSGMPACPVTFETWGHLNIYAAILTVTMFDPGAQSCRGNVDVLGPGWQRILTATVTPQVDTANVTIPFTMPLAIPYDWNTGDVRLNGYYVPSAGEGHSCVLRALVIVRNQGAPVPQP